jgi:hypothetical protein
VRRLERQSAATGTGRQYGHEEDPLLHPVLLTPTARTDVMRDDERLSKRLTIRGCHMCPFKCGKLLGRGLAAPTKVGEWSDLMLGDE